MGGLYDRSDYNTKGQLVRTQRDTGSGSSAVSMAPTLYEYDGFGNITKQTHALADQAAPDNSPIQEYAYTVENAVDGIYQVTAQTRYNAQGQPLTSVHKQLISEFSSTLETKTVIVNERGLTAMEWREYAGMVKKLQQSAIPTSDITAQTVTVDGFALSRSDHAGITPASRRQPPAPTQLPG